MPPTARPLAERIRESVVVDPVTGCWLWRKSTNDEGYAQIGLPGQRCALAHRVSYEVFVGPIPEGLVIDHVRTRGCRHRHCVNPEHLEAVTNAENVRRAPTNWQPGAAKGAAVSAARRRAATHCKRGHEFTPENTRVDAQGRRKCRACLAGLAREHRRKAKR